MGCWGWKAVWKWKILAGGTVAVDVGAVFVLETEEGPHPAAEELGEGEEEGESGRVLGMVLENEVEDPVETEERVEEKGNIVTVWVLEAESITEEGVFCVGVEERPIHDQIPSGRVDTRNDGKSNKDSSGVVIAIVETPERERDVVEDGKGVFSAVGQVRECILGVSVTSETLKQTPTSR